MAQIDSPIPGGTAERPRRRIGLFLPYILLAALVLAWTVGWFVIRARAESEMDAWLAHEAQEGRQWTCADRSITGFPFRLELRCASVRFARSDGRFSLGPITAVVQIYDPRHLLLEATGPFRVEQGDLSADVSWNALEASFHGASDGFTGFPRAGCPEGRREHARSRSDRFRRASSRTACPPDARPLRQ